MKIFNLKKLSRGASPPYLIIFFSSHIFMLINLVEAQNSYSILKSNFIKNKVADRFPLYLCGFLFLCTSHLYFVVFIHRTLLLRESKFALKMDLQTGTPLVCVESYLARSQVVCWLIQVFFWAIVSWALDVLFINLSSW